jgi:benzodiazapine receptor
MIESEHRPLPWLVSLPLAVAPVVAASVIGSLATLPNIPGWYASIVKPWFTPPNWIFGPVWTVLYAMMAYAMLRILRRPAQERRIWPIVVFMLQVTLNAAWSVAFFGGRSPLLGMIVIVPLCLSVAWNLALFRRRDRISGALLAPYLAWVTFAGALNFAIWRLNG